VRTGTALRAQETAPPPLDRVLATIADGQHGLVKTAQLMRAGLSPSGISARVRRGALHRRHRGVYSVGHRVLSREAEMLAGVFAAGDGAALSHEAVAELRNLIRYRAPVISVVAPRRRTVPGVRVYRCTRLHPLDVVIYRGIPVTTVARMLVDLTDVFIADELVNVIHEAAYRNLFNLEATRRSMARANGRHDLHVLEEALELYLHGSAGLKSRKERAFLPLVKAAGIVKPLVNTKVEGIEVDFHWPDRKRIVEVDGFGHRRPTIKRVDPLRDAELRDAGWTVLRIPDTEIEQHPERVIERLKAYL
jgi:Transcriptional regulator, AbiEi antitoxin/Protein of unknown function (DUF559)